MGKNMPNVLNFPVKVDPRIDAICTAAGIGLMAASDDLFEVDVPAMPLDLPALVTIAKAISDFNARQAATVDALSDDLMSENG